MTGSELLNLTQAAQVIGAHRTTLHRFIRSGQLKPALVVGHMSYYTRADVEALPPIRRGRPRREAESA